MVNEFNVACIRHSDLAAGMLEAIIRLKGQYWKYPLESQRRWIRDNIEDGDLHLCIKNAQQHLIGYLNLVRVKIIVDGDVIKYCGVGNVCVDAKHRKRNFGTLLMSVCNYYLPFLEKRGVLLCAQGLAGFYEKAGWHRFGGRVLLRGNPYEKTVMFNYPATAELIEIERGF